MKYCQKCGKELMDEAVVCSGCGCEVKAGKAVVSGADGRRPASVGSVVLGIIGIVGGILIALVGHICSIISIILGIVDCTKNRKPTGLILGIIGEVISILSSIIGAAIMSSLF